MCANITFFLEAREAFALTCVFEKLWNLEIEKSFHCEKKKTFRLIVIEKKCSKNWKISKKESVMNFA